MKKHIRTAISLVLLLGVMLATFASAQAVEPRYTGISQLITSLTISSKGAALCKGEVTVNAGYTADLTVELKQDGTTIKTWTKTGSGTLRISETHYVMSGHDYIVTATATVYDSNNRVIEMPHKNTPQKSY